MKNSEIELPSNRKFGFLFTFIFVVMGTYFLKENNGDLSLGFYCLGLVVLVITLLSSAMLTPFNKAWMRFGFLLGMLVSPIVLGVLFFGLFTPIAVGMRLFGRDELRLKTNGRISHWKAKQSVEEVSSSFINQF